MRIVVGVLILLAGSVQTPALADDGAEIVARAMNWLGTLDAAQRRVAVQPFTSPDRKDWHYVPRARRGLALRAMQPLQRRAAQALVAAALGPTGYAKAEGVFALEAVLHAGLSPAARAGSSSWRDPLLYQIAIFGEPASTGVWGLRVEGHHLSVNLTLRDGRVLSATPLFFGASPSAVRRGAGRSLRPLAAEEDQARALVRALPPESRRRVIVSRTAPGDVLFGPFRAARPTGQGVEVGTLDEGAQRALKALIATWVESAPASVSQRTLAALVGPAFSSLRFLWLGSLEAGRPHAYRIEGPTILLEYVNRGDHVHTVWRSPTRDFGVVPSIRPARSSAGGSRR